MPGQARQARIR